MQDDIVVSLKRQPRRWLLTGSAGFIGSNLLETLLAAGQSVVSLDSFATGYRRNLDQVRLIVGEDAWSRHRFVEGDIADRETCRRVCEGVDVVLHQAALGSVPRSIADPVATHSANATGFIHMLVAAKDAGVARFVYAASSSTYGDSTALPKIEDVIGRPLSPYAVTKYLNELYADVFARCYGMATIGLRYFNVFGPRQDPEGAYAAVIPRWVADMLAGRTCVINGDGQTSRDFCYVSNAVQANLRAAMTKDPKAVGQVYNIAVGQQYSLLELHGMISGALQAIRPEIKISSPMFSEFRDGDVRHSWADIGKANELLGYRPTHDLQAGLSEAVEWYVRHLAS
jgi:UDP-N-acetylglucosamine/UDP-N-acetylgalactosamine 4-epimerase